MTGLSALSTRYLAEPLNDFHHFLSVLLQLPIRQDVVSGQSGDGHGGFRGDGLKRVLAQDDIRIDAPFIGLAQTPPAERVEQPKFTPIGD